MKACCRCGVVYPATSEFFSRCASMADGLTSQCKVCRKAMWKAQYEKSRDYHIARSTASTKKRREIPEVRERERVWAREHKRKLLADPVAREKHRKQVREWFASNRERVRALPSRDKAILAHYSARYNADKLRATPVWADLKKIAALYRQAKQLSESTGVPHEVDHKVPLRHTLASGLHVHQNLQVITASANKSKSNRFITVI